MRSHQQSELFRLASFCSANNTRYVFAPPLQCVPHVSLIFRTIIDARNASPMTTHMIEDGFDNMRENAEFSHHRCGCSAEVVQTPVPYRCWQALVKVVLAVAPACPPATPHEFTVGAGLAFENRPDLMGDGKLVLAP